LTNWWRGNLPINTCDTTDSVIDDLTSFRDQSVLVTGHTGFKGSWLALWLHQLGAAVTGFSLEPPSNPNHFEVSKIGDLLVEDIRGDIRDASLIGSVVRRVAPDVIFHLAAQPIVRTSLTNPRETFEVNVVGTAALLDAVRLSEHPCAVVIATSDKCYRNNGQVWGFREIDPLGGHDPYSASKAGTELVVEAYRSSFFPVNRITEHGVRVATVRAGNVIGGGDWAADRIVPDAVRALASGVDLIVRNPDSTRPWQHVLEPLSGYLTLAARLFPVEESAQWTEAWNFGPSITGEAKVSDLANALVKGWGSGRWSTPVQASGNVEAATLRIASDKAVSLLGWQPRWGLNETVRRTVDWYQHFYLDQASSMREHSLHDIASYESARGELEGS
jgi:CDP-glucose 4,6-dehydratase